MALRTITVQSRFKEAVWVSKWVDYSSKYGLGYILTDKSSGVNFNDSTKVSNAFEDESFAYYQKRKSDK